MDVDIAVTMVTVGGAGTPAFGNKAPLRSRDPAPGGKAANRNRRQRYARLDVTGVDWIILGLVLLLALFGWAQGFISGALALAGLAAGAWLGTRIGPLVLPDGKESPYAPAFGLVGALVVGAVLAGLFEAFGGKVRRGLGALPGFGALDGALGAVLIVCAGLGVVWILGALAVQSGTYELRRAPGARRILQRLNTVLPPSGRRCSTRCARSTLPAHRRAPRRGWRGRRGGSCAIPRCRSASASVVKVLGTACGLGVEGSGWVAAPGVVVTNAHVVAGERDTRGAAGRARARAAGAGRAFRRAQRPRGAARARPDRDAAAAEPEPARRVVGRDPGLSAQRALRRARPGAWARRSG